MAEFDIRDVTSDTAAAFSELVYRVYGYTYSGAWAYEPERIVAAAEAGNRHVLLGFDGSDKVRAAVTLDRGTPSRQVAEVGGLLVDPGVGSLESGQFLRLLMKAAFERAFALAHDDGLRALLTREVTYHQLTQRLARQMKFVTTGIFLGITPGWAERLRSAPGDRAAGRGATPGGEAPGPRAPATGRSARASGGRSSPAGGGPERPRMTEVVSVRPIRRYFDAYRLSLPRRFAGLVEEIYERLRLPVEFGPPRATVPESRVETGLDLRLSHASVELLEVGRDAPERLAGALSHFRDGLVELVHVLLPLDQGSLDPAIDRLVGEGCRFAAVVPRYRGSDAVVMQWLARPPLEIVGSDLHDPAARRLLRWLDADGADPHQDPEGS